MQYLEGLNNKQREAALHTEGPLLIVAGAGAGKTKTLTHRILHLIRKGVQPENILAITFTNKAAREMGERVEELLTNQGDKEEYSPSEKSEGNFHRGRGTPFVSTFHSLGVHVLKRHGEEAGIPRHFTIQDRSDSLAAVKDAIRENGIDPKLFDPKRVLDTISRQKGECVTADEYAASAGEAYFPKIAAETWLAYERILNKRNALDFDDLLLKTLHVLKGSKAVREHYQNLWQYIHIDEYQDTNAVQYEVGKLLAGDRKNICVVGDSDQNIYSWRGANIRNILNFERDFPGARVVLLEENYRSTKVILDAANAVIKKNKVRVPKNLFTSHSGGEKISVYPAYDEVDEAEFVAEKTGELLGRSVLPNEVAVLFRANYQSRALEEAFLAAGIPYHMLGTKFFERKEVKDALSFLRAALNPESSYDVKRAIGATPRGIGEKTLERVFSGDRAMLTPAMRERVDEFFALLKEIREKISTEKPSLVIKHILRASGMEEMFQRGGASGAGGKSEEDAERLENVRELASLAMKFDEFPAGEGIEKLLEEAALMSDQDSMTYQKAKAVGDTSEERLRPIDLATEKSSTAAFAPGDSVKLMTVHALNMSDQDALLHSKAAGGNVFGAGYASEAGMVPPPRAGESEGRILEPASQGLARKAKETFPLAAAQESVKLMTVHASKGLEFSHVFITGLEDGLFPHRTLDMSALGREREEEERRLFYVALTRAKEKLYLTHASVRTLFGGRQVNLPSEFLEDIPEEHVLEEMRIGGGEKIKTVYLE